MNHYAINKKLAAVGAAVGYWQTCPMCAAIEEYSARFKELLARVELPETTDELVRFEARRFCAWCGLSDVQEHRASREVAADCQLIYDALNAGRACAPEVWAAFERCAASLDETLAPVADEWRAIKRSFDEARERMPPARFPYVCKVEGCHCRNLKQDAA